MAAKTDHLAWLKALTRAALPGTQRVVLSYVIPEPGRTVFSLTCLRANGDNIPDPRDYDILKSVMSPLEKLCTCEEAPLTVELNLEENTLSFESKA